MKNAAARVAFPFLLALLSVSMAVPGCAGVFDKCVKPEITAAVKMTPAELAKTVAAFLTCGVADLPDLAAPCAVAGLANLALALGPGGEEAVNCIIAYYEGNASGLLQSRARAVGAKRGVTPELYNSHACNGLQMRAPHAPSDQRLLAKTGGSTGSTEALGDAPGAAYSEQPTGEASTVSPGGEVPGGLLSARTPPATGAGLVGGGGGLKKENAMHYKNGREAKNGDKVVMIQNGKLYTGVLHDAVAGNDYCNGALAPLPQATYCNLKECLHMDDAIAALPTSVPDSSIPPADAPKV